MPSRGERIGLPPRPFLYTLDQIATLIATTVDELKKRYIFYDGTPGRRPLKMMRAANISPDSVPDWRVTEAEFVRWMKHHGLRVYDRSWDS